MGPFPFGVLEDPWNDRKGSCLSNTEWCVNSSSFPSIIPGTIWELALAKNSPTLNRSWGYFPFPLPVISFLPVAVMGIDRREGRLERK
jgi:hypothetical protein